MTSIEATAIGTARAKLVAAEAARDAYLVGIDITAVGPDVFVERLRVLQREVEDGQAALVRLLAVRDLSADENMPDTIRPTEARELLGVSRTWLWERTRNGSVPSFRIGGPDGPLRYSRRALKAIMFRQGTSPASDGR